MKTKVFGWIITWISHSMSTFYFIIKIILICLLTRVLKFKGFYFFITLNTFSDICHRIPMNLYFQILNITYLYCYTTHLIIHLNFFLLIWYLCLPSRHDSLFPMYHYLNVIREQHWAPQRHQLTENCRVAF